MVGGELDVARAWATSDIVTASSFSFCSLASLEDFLYPMSLRLSLPGRSGTSCLAHLPSSPCDELARFVLLVSLDLISFNSYANASSNIFGNTDCMHSMLWPMVYIFWFKRLGNVALSLMQITTFLAAHKNVYLGKNVPLPCFLRWLGSCV